MRTRSQFSPCFTWGVSEDGGCLSLRAQPRNRFFSFVRGGSQCEIICRWPRLGHGRFLRLLLLWRPVWRSGLAWLGFQPYAIYNWLCRIPPLIFWDILPECVCCLTDYGSTIRVIRPNYTYMRYYLNNRWAGCPKSIRAKNDQHAQ